MRILVFRVGQMGDSIVTLPALWKIRRNFPEAELILLTDASQKGVVSSWKIFGPTKIFSKVLFFSLETSKYRRFIKACSLARTIRKLGPERVYYFAPLRESVCPIYRDFLFFRFFCGIRYCFGLKTTIQWSRLIGNRDGNNCLIRFPLEAERFVQAVNGEVFDSNKNEGIFDFSIPANMKEKEKVSLLYKLGNFPKDAQIFAMAPGTLMQSKQWPPERFIELGKKILDYIPNSYWVLLGGPEEWDLGEKIRSGIGLNIINWAGKLNIVESGEMLKKCLLLVSNDSGNLHLAAAVKTPCVGIFSAIHHPGQWYPYGDGHIVIRKSVPCEGCNLSECIELKKMCIMNISVEEVFEACILILKSIGCTYN